MKSESSRIARNCKQNEPDVLTYDLQCSCDRCDSFSCFALRYKNACPCEMCSANDTESKSANKAYLSNNAFRLDVPCNESYHKERVKKEFTYDDSTVIVKTLEPKYSRASEKSIEIEISSDKAHIQSDSVLSSKDLESTTEQLGAQVMNVPYRDLKDSRRKKVSRSKSKLTSFDILKRIKEAYEACTCKVCECIVGRTAIGNGYCNCKPCNCKDCFALTHNLRFDGALIKANEGCPCIRCDRKQQCKGIKKTPKSPYCDCDPFEYISNSFNNPCNCKPCECNDCKSYLTGNPNSITVGQMNVDTTPSYCSCSPCDCASCVQRLPIASSLQHEMSTSISRPTNCTCDSCMSQACESNDSNTCSCEVQRRVMRKPVEKDTRDYGIHRALVTNNYYNNFVEKVKSTLAMFAAIGYSFPKFQQDRKSCDCADCECLICNGSDQIANKITSSTFQESSDTETDLIHKDFCKCSSCECAVCNHNIGQNVIVNNFTKCACDICDCLQCDGLTSKKRCINNNKLSSTCKCKPCKYNDCQSIISNCTGETCERAKCKCQMCTNKKTGFNKKCTSSKLSEKYNEYYQNISLNENKLEETANPKGNVLPLKQLDNPRKEVIIMDQISKISNFDVNKLKLSYSQSSETSKFSGIFLSDSTPFHRSKSSKNIVNTCLNDVMNTSIKGQIDFEENYPLEYTQNQYSNYKLDNNKLSIYRTQLLEDNSLIKSINNKTNSIGSVTVLKASNSKDNKDSEINDQTTFNRKALDLCDSLRRANTQLDTIYNKSKYISKRDTESNNKESDEICKTIIYNKEQINNTPNVVDNVIDVGKLKYCLKQAKTFSLELTELLRQYENANKGIWKRCASITGLSSSDFNIGYKDNNSDNTSIKDNDMHNISQLKVSQSDHNGIVEMYNSFSGYMISDTKNRDIVKKDTTKENISSLSDESHIRKPGESNHYRSASELHMSDFRRREIIDPYKLYESKKRENVRQPDEIQLPYTNEVYSTETHPQASVTENFHILESRNNESLLASPRIEDQSEIGIISEITQSSLKTVNSTEDQNGVSILKKNTTLFHSPFRKPKPVCVIPTLTFEVKNMRSLLRQSSEDSEEIGNEAATSRSQNNIKKEKEEGFDNVITDSKNTYKMTEKVKTDVHCNENHPKFEINCDVLKVKDLGLRRVSDHTVLVKWKSPRDVAKIEGYEILVDGRAVQKILNPSRCMAVVSCLPRIGQILITIRTLIACHQFAHFPSATVIYQPRLRY